MGSDRAKTRGALAADAPIPPVAPDAPDPRPAPPLTFTRLLGGFVVNCALFFVLAVVFSTLGPLGLTPAIVVSTTLTGRIVKIRRMSALVKLGVLTFAVMVGLVWILAVITIYQNGQLAG
jgi:hypothetical protein